MLLHHLAEVFNFIHETGTFNDPTSMSLLSKLDHDATDESEGDIQMPGITLSSPPQLQSGRATSQQTISPQRGAQTMSRGPSQQGQILSPQAAAAIARGENVRGQSFSPGQFYGGGHSVGRGEGVRMRTPPGMREVNTEQNGADARVPRGQT